MKMKRKEMMEIINRSTDQTMTRMEAWEASKSAGLNISWEVFKRVCRGKVWKIKNK